MAEIEKKWYVIRAISGKEKKVKELLELEIDRHKLNDYVEQVLICLLYTSDAADDQ